MSNPALDTPVIALELTPDEAALVRWTMNFNERGNADNTTSRMATAVIAKIDAAKGDSDGE